MPELPEVETTVKDLQKKVLGRTFVDVWTDFPGVIKKPADFDSFKRGIIGKRILKIWRRGKNIIFNLSGDCTMLIHQKMTGHILIGNWQFGDNRLVAASKGPLKEAVNGFIHLMFRFDGILMMALSDLRKFAKVELWERTEFERSKYLASLGPEPLEESFTYKKFKEAIIAQKGKIKQVLMDQSVLVGIGNIYSDEILWEAKINPLRCVPKISSIELRRIYKAMKKVLDKAIKLKGDSMSDYRLITGERGGYQKVQKAYQRQGKPCFRRDGGIIQCIKIGGRTGHFCPICQK